MKRLLTTNIFCVTFRINKDKEGVEVMAKEDKRPNPYPLRLPCELNEVVRKLAEENRRSINSQVVIMLEDYLRLIGHESFSDSK